MSARDQYNNGANDMAKGAARFARKRALCNLIQSGDISGWIGKATSLTTNGDGKGVISVEIAKGISLKTWYNDLSDIQDDTMLSPDSDVFQEAMKLQEGETVSFSGHFATSDSDCFKEASMTLEGSMTEPEFIFHFTQIGAADVQSAAPPPAQASSEPIIATPAPAAAPLNADSAGAPAPPVNPHWQIIDHDGPMITYVDFADVKRENIHASMWVMQNYEPQTVPGVPLPDIKSVVFKAEYDCNAHLTRAPYYAVFSEQMGHGVILDGGLLPGWDGIYRMGTGGLDMTSGEHHALVKDFRQIFNGNADANRYLRGVNELMTDYVKRWSLFSLGMRERDFATTGQIDRLTEWRPIRADQDEEAVLACAVIPGSAPTSEPIVTAPGPPSPPAKLQPTGVTLPYLPPGPEIPAATASATPPVAPLPTGQVTMYDKGLADRIAWENWFKGLQGDFKTGAFFWSGQRSLPHPGSCNQMNTEFYSGCTAAKERLAATDALRVSEPDYKRGWNAYVSPGDAGRPTQEVTPGTNSGGTPQYHDVGRPVPLHAGSANNGSMTLALPVASQNSGSNLPNPVPTAPKCFTVYPAVPPSDCFAH